MIFVFVFLGLTGICLWLPYFFAYLRKKRPSAKFIRKNIREDYISFGVSPTFSKRNCLICFREMRNNSDALKYMKTVLQISGYRKILKTPEIQKILLENKLKTI